MLKISHGTRIKEYDDTNGYGYATVMMLKSLTELGYEVNRNDPTADVEIWFDQPQHWNFTPGTYKIGYHPWESTLLLPGWADMMNQCDEIWTPSPLIADWYVKHAGIKVPVYVYEHGVEKDWTPVHREVNDMCSFLHVGADAARKGGKDVIDAFRAAFPRTKPDVELNMKMISSGWKIGTLRQINVLNQKMKFPDLVKMFHDNHVYVYPSWGEGFGLTPIQALATGMPTITLPAWAPYSDFLDPNLAVGSKLYPSPWPQIHPGLMLKPSHNDLVESMRYAYNHYEDVRNAAMHNVLNLMERYNWNRLTKEAFENLENRLEKS